MEITGYLRHRLPEAPRTVEDQLVGEGRSGGSEDKGGAGQPREHTLHGELLMDESYGHPRATWAVIPYRPWRG